LRTNRLIEECRRGPRLAGTAGNDRLVEQIVRALQELGYPVTRQEYTFVGWEVPEPPKVLSLGKLEEAIPSRAITWCGGSKGIDVTGSIIKKGKTIFWGRGCEDTSYERWALVDAIGREYENVYFIAKYPSHLVLPYPDTDIAYISVPPEILERLSRYKKKVRVSMRATLHTDAQSTNIIATKLGTTRNEIVVCAHHDTVYDDYQGLHDNGGGCIALVKLAETFKNIDTKHTIRFVATGSEEFNLTGAREYVRMREQNGSISRIKGCINIDFVTQFPTRIGVICTNEFDNAVNNVLRDWEMCGNIFEKPVLERKTFASDAWAFEEKGIAALHAYFGPQYWPHIPGILEEDLSQIMMNIDINVQFLKAMIIESDRALVSVKSRYDN